LLLSLARIHEMFMYRKFADELIAK